MENGGKKWHERWGLISIDRTMFAYDVIILVLYAARLVASYATKSEEEMLLRLFGIFLIQFPRLMAGAILIMNGYSEEWAKKVFTVRIVTIVFSCILAIFILHKIATLQDDEFVRKTSILIITILISVSTSIDIYFCFTYFHFWKSHTQKVGNFDKVHNDELQIDIEENEMIRLATSSSKSPRDSTTEPDLSNNSLKKVSCDEEV